MRLFLQAMLLPISMLAQQPVFRVGVDAVRVDVLVVDDSGPLRGLTAEDFELRDSGVRQRVSTISPEDGPISVMLALDSSQSVSGADLDHLKRAASAVAALLGSQDRVALLTFATEVNLPVQWSLGPEGLTRQINSAIAGGSTSLHDVAFAALILKDPQAVRTLVLLFSDGEDTISWLSGQSVLNAARRSDAVVYGVGIRRAPIHSRPGFRVDFRSGVQLGIASAPPAALMESLLSALADESGGKYVEAQATDRLVETFTEIVRQFRSRYLLTYVPEGVSASGWHPLHVRLRGGRKGRVIARRGYLR